MTRAEETGFDVATVVVAVTASNTVRKLHMTRPNLADELAPVVTLTASNGVTEPQDAGVVLITYTQTGTETSDGQQGIVIKVSSGCRFESNG
jgi:hypothetical protein